MPCSVITGRTPDLAVDYCQLLLYIWHTNPSILEIIGSPRLGFKTTLKYSFYCLSLGKKIKGSLEQPHGMN